MDKIKNYNIVFSGLPIGKTDFQYDISQSFFDLFDFDQDFSNPNLHVDLVLDKRSTMLELEFKIKGGVELVCDLTNDNFVHDLEIETKIIVKFGDVYDDSDVEIIVLPREEYQINIRQILYEAILIALPLKRVHPDVLSGKSNSDMLELLEKYSIDNIEDDDSEDDIDPRWAKLKDLKP